MKVKGIFINCKDEPFVDLIMENRKRVETRTKDVFKGLFGDVGQEFVALIETGKGTPTIKGQIGIRH